MIKLKNPYATGEGYHCFGCSPSNPSGLRMEFFEAGEEIRSIWEPGTDFQGFQDILHGGIQATLMDEIASWVVFLKLDTAGVTCRMQTRYRKPVRISSGPVTLKAVLEERKRSMATIYIILMDGNGVHCSDSEVVYFLWPPEKARSEMHYPGKEAFYPEK